MNTSNGKLSLTYIDDKLCELEKLLIKDLGYYELHDRYLDLYQKYIRLCSTLENETYCDYEEDEYNEEEDED